MIFHYQKPCEQQSFSDLFKEIYFGGYTEKDLAYIRLIERYWKALPYKLIRKYHDLKEQAKLKSEKNWLDLRSSRNSFLGNLPKDDNFNGSYFPITLVMNNGNKKEETK